MPSIGRKSAALAKASASIRAPAWLAAPRESVSVMPHLRCMRGLAPGVPGRWSVPPSYAAHATLAAMTDDLERISGARRAYADLAPRVIAREPWPLAEDYGTG